MILFEKKLVFSDGWAWAWRPRLCFKSWGWHLWWGKWLLEVYQT